ncbi:TonB-dependent receptor plug domain-containing protein [Brevundimonas sanguinis]|uniref:TonB-dependent receptor plug domain-containing protein n=1 Tax=Brevundimonas sanguinis TaxID=3021811 RepID=UPI0024155955|nr:TonB-dependent receptor [Brevundimonas sp. NCCP 15609]
MHRKSIWLATASLGWAIATAAAAGGAVSAGQEAEPPDSESATVVSEVVVTGTRLRLPDYTGSNPVVSVSSESLENSGATNLTDFLTDMPALVGSKTSQSNANTPSARGDSGLNLLSLRNLGPARTLVVVDGRRHVAAQAGSASVDVNTIPAALIDRVEILTGGASAIYGADGVTGVVNFVLKDDFEGLDMRAQWGAPAEHGGETGFVSVLGGWNFHDGRGNATLGVEYSDQSAIRSRDRDFSHPATAWDFAVNPYYTGAPGEYTRGYFRDVRFFDSSPGGAVYTRAALNGPSTAGVSFNGDGTPWNDGLWVGTGYLMLGGDGTALADVDTDLVPGLTRSGLNATMNYAFSPALRLFGEAKYVRVDTDFQSQAPFDYALSISVDNPYMPAPIYNDAMAPGGTGLSNYRDVIVSRDHLDFGRITRQIERETTRFVLGLEGDLSPTLSYEISANYGRTREDNTETNNRIHERFFAALDAVDDGAGNIVCRSNLDPTAIPLGNRPGWGSVSFNTAAARATWGTTFTPGANSGCVPINVFGEGAPSREALDWIMVDSTMEREVEQFVLNGFVSGDSAALFSLPAGPISWVVGAEYRREGASYTPSNEQTIARDLNFNLTWLGQSTPFDESFHVSEAFAEVSVPVLRDLPLVDALTVDGAYRYSDYSTIGGTDTWKLGLTWRVNDAIMLRSTQAQSVRAPNISELFLPSTQQGRILNDPCDAARYNIGPNPTVREVNCRAMLGLSASDPYTFVNTFSGTTQGVISGNVNLGPETADTFTAGLVLTPGFLRGLTISIDYYDIDLEGAVFQFTGPTIIDKCYDLPQPNQFCDLFSRDAANQHRFRTFQEAPVNVSAYETSGTDFSIRYAFDPADFGVQRDFGRFAFTLVGSHLNNLTFIEDPTDPDSVSEEAGTAYTPKWQASFDLTWRYRNLTANYGFNWFDETVRYQNVPENYLPADQLNYSARATQDAQIRYDVDQALTVYGGVNNLTNQEPDIGSLYTPVSPLGRFFYIGAKVRTDSIGSLIW